MYPYVIADHTISVLFPSGLRLVDDTHINFLHVRDALRRGDFASLPNLMDIPSLVTTWSRGFYKIENDSLTYKDQPVPHSFETRVLSFIQEGRSVDNLLAFHERLSRNPSHNSIKQLYQFLEHKNLPIDHEGYFYAYKGVRTDWYDIYSGTVLNTIGAQPSMARSEVDDNPRHHCSKGYHVGSLEYASSYAGGGRLLICKIDPANVVSVPEDCNCQKVRVTTYQVVEEYRGPLPSTSWVGSYDDDNNDFDDGGLDWTDDDDIPF